MNNCNQCGYYNGVKCAFEKPEKINNVCCRFEEPKPWSTFDNCNSKELRQDLREFWR
jgi:hypothetical protein